VSAEPEGHVETDETAAIDDAPDTRKTIES
jgi:hypothetical protein